MNRLQLYEILDALAALEVVSADLFSEEIKSIENKIKELEKNV